MAIQRCDLTEIRLSLIISDGSCLGEFEQSPLWVIKLELGQNAFVMHVEIETKMLIDCFHTYIDTNLMHVHPYKMKKWNLLFLWSVKKVIRKNFLF